VSDAAIVGMGAIFPGAGDAAAFWSNICAGFDAITEVPPGRWDPDVYYRPGQTGDDSFYCRRGGFVDDLADFDPAQFGIMPAAVHGIEPDQLLVLRAAAEAIAGCGTLPDRERIGVIIGRGGYLTPGVARLEQRVHTAHQLTAILRDLVPDLSQERLDTVRTAFRNRLSPGNAESSIGLVPNFAASRVANRFDLRGPAYTVDAACASSLLALDHAVRELASGRCDAVLAGGVHTCHHPTLWSVFSQLRALSARELIRPFDSRADGTLLSEGAGAVLLKRLDDALAAGDQVYAVIRGIGVASDGRATSMMNPLPDGQELAMRRAWADAGLDPAAPDALGLLEAHGTATPVGDQVELETLRRVFGPPGGGSAGDGSVGIGTVKSMIGHAMPAAGMAGLIKAAFAVYHGVLPPTLNIEEPHPALALSRFVPVTRARPWEDGAPRRAAVNAFGFGGINAHVILEGPAAGAPRAASAAFPAFPAPPAPPAPEEPILRLAATSPAQMRKWLDAPDADLLTRAGTEPGSGPCRLAIVAPDPRRLALARKIVSRGTPWRGRSDVWFTPRPLLTRPDQIAFLFPGFEPEFAPRIEGVAEFFGFPAPRLNGVDPGKGVVEHALDVIAVSRLFAGALSELGIAPGVLAGHSLGEWTAMIVAGIYPEIDAFIASIRPGMVEVPDVLYAALGASADRARDLLAGSGEVVVTHDNCPRQSVVCGPAALVTDVVERAHAAGILAQTLPFRTGFHSPMYAPYLAAAGELVRRLDTRPPRVPIWSATSLAPFPHDPDRVRDLVLRHLVEPVRFRQLTELLHESGVRAFVQVGPGSLTGFAEDTLRDRDHIAVATAVSQRDGLAQLRRVAAALWTEGLSPRFERLRRRSKGPNPHAAVRLRLGGPLVRLTGAVEPITAGAGVDLPVHTPVLAELNALMAETASAARAIARRAGEQEVTGRGPLALTSTREFSLRTMPEVADHCLFHQAEGWPEDSDRFPVVPLTMLLEVMADAALTLAPGRVVVGFEQVRAMRWLTVEPATTARVHVASDGARRGAARVRVRIDGYASGCVLLADAYPAPPSPRSAARHGNRPAPVTAHDLYAERWMFHGPRFAGIADIESVADDGITGTVLSLPARGALLDGAGQLIGHWMQVSRTVDQTVLPTGIGAVRLYGPPPPIGSRLRCTAWIREVTDSEMRADAELRAGGGQVWCGIEGWTTRRFASDDAIWRVKLRPEHNTLSRPCPGGWNVVWERWPDTASREMMMRRYLNAAERSGYERLNALQQRRWLLGRIVVKDSVRRWLWDRGAGPIYPAEITVDDSGGELRVRGPFRAPRVSLAHGPSGPHRTCAVAIAGDGPVDFTVGMDDDGTLLVTQPGHRARPIDAATPVAARKAEGHS
jgi:acyl transferase domain-containing protein